MRTTLLSGVELRRHDDRVPGRRAEFEPYAHQQDLQELFQTSDEFLAVNDSPTGGGKTMSWLAPVVERGEHALAVYPTNALIHDQYDQLTDELDESFPGLGSDIEVLPITADTLRTRYAPSTRTRRRTANDSALSSGRTCTRAKTDTRVDEPGHPRDDAAAYLRAHRRSRIPG